MDCKSWRPFFCSQLLAELNLHSSVQQKPPFKNPRSAIVKAIISKDSKGESMLVIMSQKQVVQALCLNGTPDVTETELDLIP